jgi:hypothetical protein
MNGKYIDELDDFDSDELTPAMRAQLRHVEEAYQHRARDRSRTQARRRKVLRRLDDWQDARRLRDEVDYLR